MGGWTLSTTTLTGTGVTLSSTGDAYIAFGTTPPTSPTVGTGIFINKTGLFGLVANVQKVKIDAVTGVITATDVVITGGSVTGITDIAIADGGTGASTAAAGRTNLQLDYENGTTSRGADTASGTQTIAHGLGNTPNYVRITVACNFSAAQTDARSVGVYNGTTSSCLFSTDSIAPEMIGTSTNMVEIHEDDSPALNQIATIAMDATNITLTWTRTGGTSVETMYILWEARG